MVIYTGSGRVSLAEPPCCRKFWNTLTS